VNRNKYSVRQLVDLEINHTKSPMKNLNDKSDKDINEQSNRNLNNIKNILNDCKKICLNFQMYVENIEQLYDKEDEEQFILKSTEKIDKLRTMLEKKQKDLTTSYQLWFKNKKKSATRRSNKVVNDNKSFEEREKCTEGENRHISSDEQDENKAVSECDSEEIFSADETRSPQKMQATRRKVDTARIENSLSNNEINTDDKDKISIAESKNNDKDNVSMQDDLITSPILGLKERKTSTERSSKKQLFSECNKSNNEIQLTNENANDKQKSNLSIDIYNDETEIENSLSKSSYKKVALENDETNQSNKRNIINESMDMFDTSPENAEENRMEVEINVETNCDKEELLHASKDKFLDPCESSLQDKIPSEKEKTSLSIYDNGEEKDVSNQNNQKKTNAEVSEDLKVSGKTNVDDNESLDDAEALAKKTLLATDSDTLDTFPDENVAKLTEDLTTNNINRNEKKNETEGNDSDVNSVSTIILSTFIKEANTDAEKNIITKAEIKAEKKSDDRSDKRSRQKVSSSEDEDAKKALLESNSDDSILLSSESGKFTDKKSESDSYGKNAEAKLSLLASSSENSSSEPTLSETANVLRNIKHVNHESEPENDGNESNLISRLKKRKLKLDKNHHYKNDKKLRMSCKVHLTRLNMEVLKCYSRALRKSREYLEHKALKRYQILSVKHMSIVLHRLA